MVNTLHGVIPFVSTNSIEPQKPREEGRFQAATEGSNDMAHQDSRVRHTVGHAQSFSQFLVSSGGSVGVKERHAFPDFLLGE